MEVIIKLKDKKEPVTYTGDRIDVLDFNMNGTKYKQIRYFKKGFSKSELIDENLIIKITKKEEN
ncbi:hypothetical protein [Clostridium senegalense]|uniref:hypothetical protein n=1 Tax=Clostridium senegalense TaxID=1465809 RepID=UPI001C1256D3|nr:hypothetical protein [Clostridium senegalense]MBU5227352.1 hypothetical protein [Clostridium senegalense]